MGELRSASVTLAEILAYIKQTRQTGRLQIRVASADSAAVPAALTFETGHLVDARRGPESGDDLVYRLVAEHEASFRFDHLPADQLPTDRSISHVQELLLLAALGLLTEEDQQPADAAPAVDAPPVEAPAAVPDPDPEPAPERTPVLVAAAIDAPAPPEPAAVPPAVAPLPADPPPAPPPRVAPPAAVPAEPPAPPLPRPARPFRRHNSVPLPPGSTVQTVDVPTGGFDGFLGTLERRGLSGYVVWRDENAEGLLVLYEGRVIEAFWAEGTSPRVYASDHALRRLAAAAGTFGRREIEIHKLDAPFVHSYSSIAYGAHHTAHLSLEHVDLPALVKQLGAAAHTGCVKVVAGDEAVYLFLHEGRLLGEFAALPDRLEPARGRSLRLVSAPGSLVDVYTAPPPAELLGLTAGAWPPARVAAELNQAAREVLGTRAGPVISALAAAGTDPQALHAACARAKHITRVFIGPDQHAELSRRLDGLLAHLQ